MHLYGRAVFSCLVVQIVGRGPRLILLPDIAERYESTGCARRRTHFFLGVG